MLVEESRLVARRGGRACHRCGMAIAAAKVKEEVEVMHKEAPVKVEPEVKKPKKKKKKEGNAGLLLPPSKKLAGPSAPGQGLGNPKPGLAKAKTLTNSSKLKFLVAKSEPRKRGGLQDF